VKVLDRHTCARQCVTLVHVGRNNPAITEAPQCPCAAMRPQSQASLTAQVFTPSCTSISRNWRNASSELASIAWGPVAQTNVGRNIFPKTEPVAEQVHYLGYLFVQPRRHVQERGDLSPAKAGSLGRWVTVRSRHCRAPWNRVADDHRGRAGQGGKESHLLGATRAGLGVVDNEQLPLGAADGELLAAEREVPDVRVVDAGRHTLARLNIVPGPEPSESFAGQRQFADELDEHDTRLERGLPVPAAPRIVGALPVSRRLREYRVSMC